MLSFRLLQTPDGTCSFFKGRVNVGVDDARVWVETTNPRILRMFRFPPHKAASLPGGQLAGLLSGVAAEQVVDRRRNLS